jgi:hypothetical protein
VLAWLMFSKDMLIGVPVIGACGVGFLVTAHREK